MFPYDSALGAAVQHPIHSIADVVEIMQTIDANCTDGDGLKWFNWLYLQVTQAVETRVSGGAFDDPAWLAQLDVQFAQLYFRALESALTGASPPGCWQALFEARHNIRIARIQFALCGMNAHINHDLPQAIVSTCKVTDTAPQHGNSLYNDYTAVNSTLDTLIEAARQALHVRLLGDALPAISNLEDLIAGWDISAARECAWRNAESLWNLPSLFAAGLMESIDGLTTVIGKALLAPVP
ncbi:MAG TPA: DUF5995 family protein [Bryobacteraceae bacterium]|nr:DUF5995 family protein [Bryobacteraceae bacterium]